MRLRCKNVILPFYLKHLYVLDYKTQEVRVGFIPVLKFWFSLWWFMIPSWIEDYNTEDCVNFIPDFRKKDGSFGTKIKPFLGMVVTCDENAAYELMWWKNISLFKR